MSALFKNQESVLIVAAHPDDEVLGCGGSIAKHISCGHTVDVIFLADGETSRNKVSCTVDQRRSMALNARNVLKIRDVHFANFPDQKLDVVGQLAISKQIEKIAQNIQPTIVYTHSPADLNRDHRLAYDSVMAAFRPLPNSSVRVILTFEIPSSTGWMGPKTQFEPSVFIDIREFMGKKISALCCYEQELHPSPHPRSLTYVKNLAQYRGSMAGLVESEAFELQRLILN